MIVAYFMLAISTACAVLLVNDVVPIWVGFAWAMVNMVLILVSLIHLNYRIVEGNS